MKDNNIVMEQKVNEEDALFSVILLHYNQQNYIIEALSSVFAQEYSNIELIIADDASTNLDIDVIKAYIEDHRTERISDVKYQLSEFNQGTVRNVNDALKAASGKNIMFFAADDALFDAQVITNFSNALSMLQPDQYMVSAQCAMMDENMERKISDFVNVQMALNMNKLSPIEQYREIASSCSFAMGATAFKAEMLAERGFFDETYEIIEDWSYYLSLTLNGSKIIYFDFNALRHRDGGVSHFNDEILPPHVIKYRNDSLLIQESLILPHLSSFPISDQMRLLARYFSERKRFAALNTDIKRPSQISIVKLNKKLYMRKMICQVRDRAAHYRQKCIHWAKLLLPTWFILRAYKIFASVFIKDTQLMFVGTQAYDVITMIVLVMLITDLIIFTGLVLLSFFFFLRKIMNLLFSKNQ